MKDFELTRYDIAKWYDLSLEIFKIRGVVSELLKESETNKINVIESVVVKNGNGYIINEPSTIQDKELFLTLKQERNRLLNIKNSLLDSQNTSVIADSGENFNRTKENINTLWSQLDINIQNKFYKSFKTFIGDNNSPTDPYILEINKLRIKENKFNKAIPISKVISHFNLLTQKTNKKGNSYLTSQQLFLFIKKGFLNEPDIDKQHINYSFTEKGMVIKLFYEFFDMACDDYSVPRRKKKFINLIVDCFEGFSFSSVESLFKANKTSNSI